MFEGIVEPFPMAIHAGFSGRFLNISGRMESGCALLALSMAGDTVNIRRIHQTWRVRDSEPSASAVEFSRPQMDLFAMAPVAHRGRMDGRENRADLVPNVTVTIGALDLMVGHMILVHQLGSIFRAQDFRLIMALNAFSFWDVTVPLNDMDMTSFAGDPSGNILPVIETPALNFDISFGFNMAGGTASYGTGNTLLLSLWTRLVIVADEAIDFMNRQVFPLNELSMTAGTAKLHSPPQLT